MQGTRDRIERARLGARSAARDLLRLVKALDSRGVRIEALEASHREALEACNHDLATALSNAEMTSPKGKGGDLDEVESMIATSRERLRATREAILDRLGKKGRVQVLEALLSVEVADDDLAVEIVPDESDALALAAARAKGERRMREAQRSEGLRRRAEQVGLDPDLPAADLYALLPPPWHDAICRHVGAGVRATPAALVRRLAERRTLAKLVGELRTGEREALRAILDADGLMLARVVEARFGTSLQDGFEWLRLPPTSILGRLRVRGLCLVGRTATGPNPRSRPRVVLVPRELRASLRKVLATATPRSISPTVGLEHVARVMDEGELTDDQAEAEGVLFDRAQPELASFGAAVADSMSDAVGSGSLLYYMMRVWRMFELAHPGQVPRLRPPDISAARQGSAIDLDAVEVMHERLLERRVTKMIASQPHVYSYIAGALDDLPWSEEDKLLVFHACDTTLRALDAALR